MAPGMKLYVDQFVHAEASKPKRRAVSPVGLAVWFVAIFGLALAALIWLHL